VTAGESQARREIQRLFRPFKVENPAAMEPDLSVIVVTLDAPGLARKCIASLAKQTYTNFEVILVDNGSKEDEAALLAGEFPSLKTIRLLRNSGLTGGVNAGVKLAASDLVVLLNNDAEAEPNCLAELVRAYRAQECRAVSARIINEAEGEQESRHHHSLSFLGYSVFGALDGETDCLYPSGGACLIDRGWLKSGLDALGLGGRLFPDYFAYHEDAFTGALIRTLGGRIVRAPDAVVRHAGSQTSKRLPHWYVKYLQLRNRLLNAFIFFDSWTLLRLTPLLFADWLAHHAMMLTSGAAFRAVLTADGFFLETAVGIVLDRLRVDRLRQVSEREFLRLYSMKSGTGSRTLDALVEAYLRAVGIRGIETWKRGSRAAG
jgi:GT2 family glycosyltransferase